MTCMSYTIWSEGYWDIRYIPDEASLLRKPYASGDCLEHRPIGTKPLRVTALGWDVTIAIHTYVLWQDARLNFVHQQSLIRLIYPLTAHEVVLYWSIAPHTMEMAHECVSTCHVGLVTASSWCLLSVVLEKHCVFSYSFQLTCSHIKGPESFVLKMS